MGIRSWIAWRGANLVYGTASRLLWPRASAAAIVVENGKMLAIDTGDYLMLPAGGLEYGESFAEAVEREAMEETGYEIEVEERICESINSVGGAEMIFKATLAQEDPVSDGTWEGKPVWIDLEDAPEKRWRHNRDMESILSKCNTKMH